MVIDNFGKRIDVYSKKLRPNNRSWETPQRIEGTLDKLLSI